MLYLAIDQHAKQLTVNLRNEEGQVMLRRQVSTRWEPVRAFFIELQRQAQPESGYAAVLEVCGFNDWLVKLLGESGCREIVVCQSKEHKKRKTDRIDANSLGERLWINRHRLAAGQRLQDLRRIELPSPEDARARQCTRLRLNLGRQRTRTVLGVHHILFKHNLKQSCPTKGLRTMKARRWLEKLALDQTDRLELDGLLAQWRLWDEQIAAVQKQIAACHAEHPWSAILQTLPGLRNYAGLGIAARIGRIERFPRPGSLANFWGLVPSCRNSGESTKRLGSITKEGSSIVRFLLGNTAIHMLRVDARLRAWHRRVKQRRGSKIARVGVMRRVACLTWHMVRYNQPYDPTGIWRQIATRGATTQHSTT